MPNPTINKNTGLDYTIFRDIYNRLENAAQLDVSGNLTVCGDLLVKQCLNVENIVYDTETIDMSGQTISGSKSLSWIDTSGSGVLEDGIKDGFYKKVVKLENTKQVSVILDQGGASGEWVVPVGITSITVEAYGAGGGGGHSSVGLGGTGGNTTWEFNTETITAGGGTGGDGVDSDGTGGMVTGMVDSSENGQDGPGTGNGGDGGGPLGGTGGMGSSVNGDSGNPYGGGGGGGDGAFGGGGGAYFLKTYTVTDGNIFNYEIGEGGDGGSGPAIAGDGADGAIIITYNESQPYTITYNTTEITVLTDKGDNACFIYNEELGEWIKLNE